MNSQDNDSYNRSDHNAGEITDLKAKEWRLFIFIIVFLFPILSVAVVGGYGFVFWMYQLIAGPRGPV
ncbi:nitrate reductase [Saccharophagus sp. K07]|jgi:nitrate reductase NapE|uniref:periplasmic nitrate reductase, NapE protein n=1 Tax=Saccharophagus sp. K07 TaxID=2283636 RepID=UPI001652279E|nr:periplasmic nitrate reductase, NapE protein [Saccharophagus sp. K07]MBC6905294.1 nitrate reductase [Saccharophagus sp. K07]